MRRLSGLNRPIDLTLPWNRFGLAASPAVGLLGYAAGAGSIADRLLAGVVALLVAFLCWALGRELDPDRPVTANVACVAGGVAAVALGRPAAGPIFLLLVASRILVGTTGDPPTHADLAVNLVVATVVAGTPAGWPAGMALALAAARDVTLPDPAPRRQLGWALAIAVAVSVRAGLSSAIGAWTAPTVLQWAVVAVGAVGAVWLLRPETPLGTADRSGTPLSSERLLWGRGTVVLTLTVMVLVGGGLGVSDSVAPWVTVGAAGAVRALS